MRDRKRVDLDERGSEEELGRKGETIIKIYHVRKKATKGKVGKHNEVTCNPNGKT